MTENGSPSWPTSLLLTLHLAVPRWQLQLKDEPFELLQARASACGEVIANHIDNVLYPGRRKGDTAEAFNRLAEAIAVLSFMPGGVTVFGHHWEAPHP